MEDVVDQCSVDKNDFEIQIKQLRIDNDKLLNQIMSQDIMHIAMTSVDNTDVNLSCMNECCKCLELETELLKKKDLVEKDVFNKLVTSYSTLEKHCISLELATQLNQEIFQKENSGTNQNAPTFNQLIFKINLKPLALKLLKNKDAHIDYIKHIHENAEILRELVKNARAFIPLDSNLDSACKYIQRIQEVLVYVQETCPCLSKPSENLVAVTPMNKDRRVRFAYPITSSSNVPKQTNNLKSQDSNKPLLHSTGINCSTSASGSKPSGNTKNNRIPQSSSSNKINKVED
ncbi:hypothetical protein Tco_0392609 [Tanacetum coccineum]